MALWKTSTSLSLESEKTFRAEGQYPGDTVLDYPSISTQSNPFGSESQRMEEEIGSGVHGV